MKPFGVRLAAGAVTILLGALAAAQAQKDKQSDSGSVWNVNTAESNSGDPPAPIAGAASTGDPNNGSWITPPPTTDPLIAGSADRSSPAMRNSVNRDGIQLVQHTDSTVSAEGLGLPDASELMPDVGTPAAPKPASETPSFSLPVAGLPAASQTDAAQLPAISDTSAWGLPAPGTDARPTSSNTPAAIVGDREPGIDAVASDAFANNQNTDNAGPASINTMPEVQLEQPPAMGFLGNPPSGQPLANQPQNGAPAEAAWPQGVPVGANGQPTNILRDAGLDQQPNANASSLADQSGTIYPNPYAETQGANAPAPMETPDYSQNARQTPTQFGLAQQSPEFGQLPASPAQPYANPAQPYANPAQPYANPAQPYANPAQPYAGPAQPFANPAQPLASPTPLGFDPRGVTQGNTLAAPARMANLPNQPTRASEYQPLTFDQPAAATPLAVDPNDTNAMPGDRRLEGVQSPSIVIQKRAPTEVKVGKPAAFVIQVQNVGSAEALDVKVHDRIPAGMRLVDASPSPVLQGDILLWQLGAMPAGDERTLTMQLIPEQEGELGSVARVTFEAAASVRTISTRPELKIVQRAPEKVLIGQQLEIELEVSNPGTGEATGVMLQEDVPDGLEHPKGRQLDNLIGTLAPGEVRRQILRMRAAAPGVIQNQIRLMGDDGLAAEHTVTVEVIAPQLKVELSGPSRRFLERQATYQLDITNVGTADASNIEVTVNLDRGFTFVSTDFEGQYDPSRHAVYWSLAQLPAGGSGAVPLTLLPVEEGEQAIRLEARADLGVIAKNERVVSVDALAELTFQIADAADPIEIGSETTYEIRVSNSGSRNDSNVRVQLQLPTGIELVSSESEAGTNGRGLVAFQPRSQLAAGGDMVYRVRVRGVAPGTHLVKAIVTSDQASVPVTKEESTMVYADR